MKASKTEGFHRHLLKDGVKVVILYHFKRIFSSNKSR